MVTFDVKSLYTNIPIDEGLRCVANAPLQNRDRNNEPDTSELIQLLRLVLTCNNFEFNGEHYLQINGTAMGTKVAPSLANIFMADLETKKLLVYQQKPLVWWRFIDDIFTIWTFGENQLEDFIKHINSCHPKIKFSAEISNPEINLLDTTVKVDENNKLYTTLYTKPKMTFLSPSCWACLEA